MYFINLRFTYLLWDDTVLPATQHKWMCLP